MTPAERYRKAAAQLTDCASREHTLKTAFIIISEKALKIECTVIDTSPTGVICRYRRLSASRNILMSSSPGNAVTVAWNGKQTLRLRPGFWAHLSTI